MIYEFDGFKPVIHESAFVAFAGGVFVFATTQARVILFGVGVLALGCVAFLAWSWTTKGWPFDMSSRAERA